MYRTPPNALSLSPQMTTRLIMKVLMNNNDQIDVAASVRLGSLANVMVRHIRGKLHNGNGRPLYRYVMHRAGTL